VYTVEEKPSKKTKETIKKIIMPHKDKFDEVLIYIHPAGMPGEAKEKILEKTQEITFFLHLMLIT